MPQLSEALPIHFFDRSQEWFVAERRLPHWSQAGVVTFITWRTWDSLPKAVLDDWLAGRAAWLKARHIDVRQVNWRQLVRQLPLAEQFAFQNQIAERWDACLDECHGACVLRQTELNQIVADSLLHFDGERYALTDFVVMPNHAHILVAFVNEEQMLKQCDSWKHYTAVEINKRLGRCGRFWEADAFDHLV